MNMFCLHIWSQDTKEKENTLVMFKRQLLKEMQIVIDSFQMKIEEEDHSIAEDQHSNVLLQYLANTNKFNNIFFCINY